MWPVYSSQIALALKINPTRNERYRFPPRMRLKTAHQFREVYRARVILGKGPLVVYSLPNDLDHPRLGLSVPRRVGGAVVRNRVKRHLREAFRLQQHELPRGYDFVINVKPHELLSQAEYHRLLAAAMNATHRQWTTRLPETRPPSPRT